MKSLLLLPASPSASPYLRYYLDVLDKYEVDYDVCIWNRSNDTISERNYFVFNSRNANSRNPLLIKVKAFDDYRKFIIKRLKESQYGHIVVFTIQLAIYLSKVLLRQYKGKYIVDIRDYSKILKIPFANGLLSKILKNSALNCISSPGFKHWLPKCEEYTISHNTNFSMLKYQANICNQFAHPMRVLTIGSIRDVASNTLILSQLGNNCDYVLKFAGDGPALPALKNFAERYRLHNVSFTGKYKKSDESNIVEECDIVNILLPHNMVSDFLMSNRFYLSVIHRKPMMVNKGCYQAKIVSQYGLGAIIDPAENITGQIRSYVNNFNYKLYNESCEAFIRDVINDINLFESKLKSIIVKTDID